MANIERKHYEAAFRLGVKKIVMCECGHAFRGAAYDGPKWLGWKEPPVPLIHAIEFYFGLLKSGKLKIKERLEEPVTLHDPCNVVRGRGLGTMFRSVAAATCADLRDVYPRYEHNYCCGAGGGVINCGPPWKPSRMEASKVKAEQLKATGAKIVITPCHNCHSGIEDIIDFYKLGMKVKFLSEILVQTMEIPEDLQV
jgi:Fe-S oxidoreductase